MGRLGVLLGRLGSLWRPFRASLGLSLGRPGPSRAPLAPVLRPSWRPLGQFWSPLRPSWGHLGGFLGRLELMEARKGENAKITQASKEHQRCWPLRALLGGSSCGPLGPSWGHLGGFLGHLELTDARSENPSKTNGLLGALLGRLRALLGASWAVFGRSGRPLEPCWAVGSPKRR